MKRHNAKAIAAAVAIAAAAAASAEGKKKADTKLTVSKSTLYVDVVKNMVRPESSPPATPPPPPKFTILREDFPALPGTQDDLRSNNSATVPDDWTAIISDDDDVGNNNNNNDDAVNDDVEVSQPSPSTPSPPTPSPPTPSPDSVSEPESVPESLPESVPEPESGPESDSVPEPVSVAEAVPEPVPEPVAELVPEPVPNNSNSSGCKTNSNSSEHETVQPELPAVAHVAATTDFYGSSCTPGTEVYPKIVRYVKSTIFDTQFLLVGMRQRAWSRQRSSNAMSNVEPPPGFENIKFYSRLRTNRLGVPLGGVTLDVTPPQANSRRSERSNGTSMEGAYGLAGLASNLAAAQQHPHLFSEIFGHEPAGLNVDAHCCACEANKLHASFAGPLQGGRCAPHEVNYDIPSYYRRNSEDDLAQPKIEQMEVELLFFFFYTYPGDMMQMLAAAELAERGWRFHIYERLWIRRQADNPHYIVCDYQECGEYNYFNMVHWKIMARHFDLLPDHLERTITKVELRDQYGYHPQMG
ncbi:uncharacterized protein LOC108649961 [Drosophila navojoa]|uniref:uncharacterized protein LOC108649961 n=1 Tax=Drosophila navojoa TaxID=7232 RepID=UPI0011BE20BD|nr:uncharacterized protein LOC108649961 [Drosophila navojoa]